MHQLDQRSAVVRRERRDRVYRPPNETIEDLEPFHSFVAQAEPFPEPKPMTPEEYRRFHEECLARQPAYKALLEKEQAERDAIAAVASKALPPRSRSRKGGRP